MLHIRRFRIHARFALGLFTLSAATACSDGGGTAPGAAWSVDFSSSMLAFTAMNSAQSVTATIRDNKGTSIPDATVSWSSENPSIAEVSGGGRTVQIIAKSPGATNIHASSGGAKATIIVTVMGVKNVQLDPANVALKIGESKTVAAHVQADAGVSTAVTWSSANTTVATVNDAGVVTAIAPGATIIKATTVADPRFHASAQVAVAPERGIVVAPSAVTLNIGKTQDFSATVSLPEGQSTAVQWSSSNAAVATVSAQGKVTAVAIGSAQVTATSAADPTLSAAAQVTVAPAIHSVVVSPATAQVYLGETRTLSATVSADQGLSQAVTWQSSSPAVATVSSSGVVTAVTTGNATITARSAVDNTKFGTATISVSTRPVSVSIAGGDLAVAPGMSKQLTATVEAAPGVSTAVTWSSNASSIATVSATGLVTGVAAGSATITATSVADPTKKASVTATVSSGLVSTWSAARLNGPLYEDVLSMYVAESNNVFAVNLVGDVFRYNGTAWTRVLQGSAHGTAFKAVHGTGPNNIFAVGTNGKIFRWQGTSWNGMASGTTGTFKSVYAVAPNAVMAVGNDGLAASYNGVTWSNSPTGSTRDLNSVWGAGQVFFAVGEGGEALRYNLGTWARAETPTVEHLRGVAGIHVDNVLAVGDFGTLLRYDGSTWSTMSSGVTADLLTVSISPIDSKVYFAGSFGTVLQLVGSTGVPIETPYGTRFLSSSFDAAGNLWTAGQRGVVQRYSGSSWNVVNLAPDLIDVWSTATNSAWAVGEFGFIYRWNGVNWQRQDAPTRERLNTVWASAANNAYAGGDGGIMLHWNGSAWSEVTFPSDNDVLAIWGTSETNVYAVTFGGEVARYNGSNWSIVQEQGNSLYGVFGSGADDVYAIGDAGTVLRFDGNSWMPRNLSASALLVGLWSAGPTNVLTVGLSPSNPTLGAAYKYNGSQWSTSSLPMTPPELTSLWGLNAFDLYATGGAGTILRYNGTTWQSMSTGTTDYLWSLTGAPSGTGGAVAVGYNSTVVVGTNAGAAVAAQSIQHSGLRSFNPSVRSRPARASDAADHRSRRK